MAMLLEAPRLGGHRRAVTPPRIYRGLSALSLLYAAAVVAIAVAVLLAVRASLATAGVGGTASDGLLALIGVGSLAVLLPAAGAVRASLSAGRAQDVVEARVTGSRAQTLAFYALGYATAALILALLAFFVVANDEAVARTFFKIDLIASSFALIGSAFWKNIYIFVIAEVLVLIWGLVIALARLAPGPAGRAVRAIATAYTDIFRGLPAIITIYLVGFGLPLTGLPIVRDFEPETYAILALTLTYGAYVAEVYRAGIESIHWSQVAAARSLGLSYAQTMRYVVVPQAVRRIVPPLLNDFISLQKDTALVNVIGAIDAFNQAKIVASNHFNLSSVTTVAILFVVITIPQARFVDRLIARDQARMRAGG